MFANVIVTTGDLVRVGDWITVKGSDADGYVTEVSLNVVKVQNFDKTVTSLPTYTLVQKSFVNWRGMFDAGGRRIKRSIYLDQRSIRMLTKGELDQVANIPLMDESLRLEQESVEGNPECTEGSRITNSGLFSAVCVGLSAAAPQNSSHGDDPLGASVTTDPHWPSDRVVLFYDRYAMGIL